MKNCQEIDCLVTPYIDGETDAQTSAAIETHLAACPPCRAAAETERVTRAAIRARRPEFFAAAPRELCRQCADAARHMLAADPRRVGRRRWVALAAAATVVLVAGTVGTSLLSARLDAAFAAQLAKDHVGCFLTVQDSFQSIDAREAAATLQSSYGWAVAVPPSDLARDLTLIGVRQCLYVDGAMAHLLYRYQGRNVSVFVVPDTARRDRLLEIVGHNAIIWGDLGRTYAVIGREEPAAMQELASYVRATAGTGPASLTRE